MPEWSDFTTLVDAELTQREEEGYAVADLHHRFGAGSPVRTPGEVEQWFATVDQAPRRPDFSYVEPSDLAEIRAQRPDGPRRLPLRLSREELADRLLGAWLGRCAGCALGKPVEGWERRHIYAYLEAAHAYPLDDYIPRLEVPGYRIGYHPQQPAVRGEIRFMPRDDDLDYTIFALLTLERHGHEFTSQHIAQGWLEQFPYHRVYTAERRAYANFVNNIWPPESAFHLNPYREWIGAQIRADLWGYVCPGQPERAAELAFRDACVSHVKNGIYGAMFVAATIAASFAVDSLQEAAQIGLTEVPKESRFAEMVRNVLDWSSASSSWEAVWEHINQHYGHYSPVHTLNNAAVVIMALLWGEEALGKTVCTAVMSGWDTDCNGATAGSVVGAFLGARRLPVQWTAPFNDTISSCVGDFPWGHISELAQRTLGQVTTLL